MNENVDSLMIRLVGLALAVLMMARRCHQCAG